MAQQSERDELVTAWRALSGERESDGWQTISISSGPNYRILAGRHFPGNEEGLLLGFLDVRPPREELMPQGHGFLVTGAKLEQQDADWGWIALSRKTEGNLELFEMMASDIVTTLAGLRGAKGRRLIEIFLARVHAWQEFMRRGGRRLLGPEGEVGLYGELEVLDSLMRHGVPAPLAVEAWQGPLGGLHDFLFGAGAIEVKSTASPASFQARIGSLEQLDDSLVSPLYVAGVQLATDSQGLTLPAKIDALRGRLADLPATKETFDRLLLHAGFYDEDAEGYDRRFQCLATWMFPVSERFPRLTKGNVPGAVTSAHYEIDLLHGDLEIVEMGPAVTELGVRL